MTAKRMFCWMAVFSMIAILPSSAVAQEQSARRPSILIDNWGGEMDMAYMRRLQAAGFEVDAIAHDKLTWERLKQYNVLALVDFPQDGQVATNPHGGPASGPNLDETLALVDRFLADGGGVMVNLLLHHYDPRFYNADQKALARWGARKPLETVVMAEDRFVSHPRLRQTFYWTDNVTASPVTEGVRGVWYPGYLSQKQGGWDWGAAGPIDVDGSWQVVLRAPKGSRTEPARIEERKPGVPYYDAPFVRPDGVTEPPLFAIRDLAPGRLALFHAHPFYHLESGLSWAHNGVMLDKGLDGKPSDFGKLLENTFRWLAAPSLAGGQLGGYKAAPDRWTRPLEKKDDPNYKHYLGTQAAADYNPNLPPPAVNLLKGIVGPRTAYSGGKGTVADYAAMARQKGLSFIIFLEDMAELTPEKLKQLIADCKQHGDKDLLLIAGYRIKSNLGNQFFNCGSNPLFIHDKYLSADKKTLMLQPHDKEGKWEASKFIDFVFENNPEQGANTLGWFDFTGPMKSGGLAIHDLRLFSMAGVMYYDHGKLVEDVTDQYLLTNAGTMTGTPVAINLVDSPEAMAAAVDGGRALTYAAASSVANLWQGALRWNHTYFAANVFPSTGPMIQCWPQAMYRTGSYAGEPFAVGRMLVTPFLKVTADAGLKEIAVYDGTRLSRRFLPNGAKELAARLFLSGSLQRNMSVVATDMKGGKAVSFPLRGWNDGSPAAVFCADHVNDGTMKMFRGPGWSRFTNIPLVPEAGKMWDGMGQVAKLPLFGWGAVTPAFHGDAGKQTEILCQTPVMESCDDQVWRGRSVSRGVLPPGSPHRNPWSGWGPIEPTPLVDMTGIYTEWAQRQTGTATGWGPMGLPDGPAASLYTQLETYKKDMTLTLAYLGHCWRQEVPVNVLLLMGEGDKILKARDIAPKGGRSSPGALSWSVGTGAWIAAVSPGDSNAMLFVNYGVPLRLNVSAEKSELVEDLPQGGLPVKAGETRKVEWFTCWWPMDKPIAGSDELLRWVRYLQCPDGMEILRGKRLDTPIGVIELAADAYAAEVKVPLPADKLDANLPFRVSGLNPRWSAILWQKDGYVGAGRYGKPQNRFRSLAVDFDGRVYFPVYSGQAPLTQMVAGQPVAADAAGKELFIEVVCLKDAEGPNPPLWHVSVNNPTDQPVTAKFSKTMELPGLDFADRELTLQPGEYRILAHPVEPSSNP